MATNNVWDIVVIGGGLAGLSFAILCAKSGRSVLVLEKGTYPRHKVCGEFVSNESKDFLLKLGLPFSDMTLPSIHKFVLTSHYNLEASCDLETGGFGISRFKLDFTLSQIAIDNGIEILNDHRVTSISLNDNLYNIQTYKGEVFKAKLAVGAYGRISGLNSTQKIRGEKFIGVKYHVNEGPPDNTIEIHNFKGGYCGISKIEDGKYNLCYLAKASDIKVFKGNIEAFENAYLKKNLFLKKRLEAASKLTEPIITAQINFSTNNNFELDYLQIGDAAGFIPPITGNGMSLAFRSAKVLHAQVEDYFANKISRAALLESNQTYIRTYLNHRIQKGIFLQSILFITNKIFSKTVMLALTNIPWLLRLMTRGATGKTI